MNNFGVNNLEIEQELVAQSMVFKFIAGSLSVVFLGAFLTGVVGAVIWLTSGGNEGRNDSSAIMMKSSLVGMFASFIGYIALKVYANMAGFDF